MLKEMSVRTFKYQISTRGGFNVMLIAAEVGVHKQLKPQLTGIIPAYRG